MITITDYLQNIYEDFKDYVDNNRDLCKLVDLNFEGGSLPNYDDVNIQQLYLLRYAFSYAFEYMRMFDVLFENESFNSEISVVSLGCGNMMDYWSLVKSLCNNHMKCDIIYEGIDIIDWAYKVEKRKKDHVNFIQINAAELLESALTLSSDIYIFPKSISEFSDDDFQAICDSFTNKEIEKDRFHILISLREDQGSMERDISRSDELISAITKNEFDIVGKTRHVPKHKNKGIKAYDHEFEYPEEAKELLDCLDDKCNGFDENFEECRCCNLVRSPILKTKYINFVILTFERKDI